MATRGVEMTVSFLAWDTAANAAKTGDSGNFTTRWIKDGTASAPTNSVSEIDATACPGVYKLTLTSTETDANIGTLAGKSSTASVSLIPTTIQFERLPNAAPGGSGGVPTVDASNHVAGSVSTDALVTTVDSVADGIATTLGTAGAGLTDLGGMSTAMKAEVNAEADTALSDYDAPTKAEMDSKFSTTDGLITALDTVADGLATTLGTAGAGLTDLGGMSTAMKAEVNAEADTALGDYDAPTKAEMDSKFSTTDGLISTVDSVADGIATTLGTAGAGLTDLGGMSTGMKAEVNAEADTALGDYDAPTKAELDSAFTEIKGSSWSSSTDTLEQIVDRGNAAWITATGFNTTTPPTAAAISDAVWDELQSGHTTSGTFGYYLDAQVSASSSPPTAAAIADAVWDELTSGHTGSGSYGKAIGDGITGWATATGFSTFDASSDSVTVGTNNDKTGYSISGTLQTLDAMNNFDPAADTVANVTTTGTVTNGVTVSTVSDGAIGADAVADIWSTTALAESYASDGSTGTPAQLLYMIQQATTEFAISGTSLTVKQIDGSTTAGVWTLDDASAPTSRTRAS